MNEEVSAKYIRFCYQVTINEDDGWISADDYDGDIPFLSDEENRMRAIARQAKEDSENDSIGVCPCCGTKVVEKDMAYFCDNMECSFAIWKDNKFFQAIGKEMTKDIAEELLNCGTAMLMGCKSRKTGKTFNCYVDITYDDEGRVQYEIRFPERKFRRE